MIHNARNVTRGHGDDRGQHLATVSLQTCGRTIVEAPDSSTLFDYARFANFQELCKVLERQDRLWKIRHGISILQLENYTEEFLIQEFQDRFGEMDTTTPKFALLLKTYKEERLNQIEEWLKEEEEYKNNLVAKGFKIIDPDFEFPEEERTDVDVDVEFSPEELAAFCAVGQGVRSGVERFILPRKEVKTVGEIQNVSIPVNLALFDPQMSLPAESLPPCPYPNSDTYPLPKLLSTIQSQIQTHVTGIKPSALFSEFDEQNNYKIDYANYCYPDFGSMLLDLHHVVWVQSMDAQMCQLYPTFMESLICTPIEFFWKIFHHIRFVLARAMTKKKVLTVRQAFEKCEQIFGFKIGPDKLQAWGFSSFEDFAHFLINYWPHHEVKLKPEKEILLLGLNFKGEEPFSLYILKETGEMKEKILKSEKEAAEKLLPKYPNELDEIPLNCLRPGDTMDWEAENVMKNEEVNCVMTYYVNPLNFNVVLYSKWEKFMNFQKKLAITYKKEAENNSLRVNPAHLTKGMFLVTSSMEEDDDEEVYYRVEYIEKTEGSDNKHKVLSVDYGDILEVEEENFRYLYESMAYEIHAQSIPCSLYNVDPLKNSTPAKPIFPKSVLDRGYELLSSPRLAHGTIRPILVSFRSQEKRDNKSRWKVRACGANRGQVPDVGRGVMEFMKKNYPEAVLVAPAPVITVPKKIYVRPMKKESKNPIVAKQGQGQPLPPWSTKVDNSKPNPSSFFLPTTEPQIPDDELPPWVKDRHKELFEPQSQPRPRQKVSGAAKPTPVSSWANVASTSKLESKINAKAKVNPAPVPEDFPVLGFAMKPRRRN